MPRTTITEEHRTDTGPERFPAVKFSQKDQRERIFVGLEMKEEDGQRVVNPWFEWVHNIKAPKVENGYALQIKHKNDDGSDRFDWDMAFIGSPICLGKADILFDKGDDPDNCPVCAEARRDSDVASPPVLRYAVNVLRYATQPGTFNVIQPFSCNVLVWRFTAKQFGKIAEIQKNIREGQVQIGGQWVYKDFRYIDLNLGPSAGPPYFNYDMVASEGAAACRASAEAVQFVRTLVGQPGWCATEDQLQAACGRKVINRNYLEMDLDRSRANWRTARVQSGAAPRTDTLGSMSGPQGQQDMTAGLSDLAAAAGGTPPAPNGAEPLPPGGLDHFAAAAAPELAGLAAQQEAALAAAGAPVAGAMADPFAGAATQAAAPVTPTPVTTPGTEPAPGATQPTPVPAQSVAPPAPAGPQPVAGDPFGGTPQAPAQPAQPAAGSDSFDDLLNF